MAGGFDYTYQSWDNIRPKLLKSTGLGDALKTYEAKKDALKKARALSDLIKLRNEMAAALDAVEVARKDAIKSCGSLFKDCKAALQAANADRELTRASEYALTKLNAAIVEADKVFKDDAAKLATRLKAADDNLKRITKIQKDGINGKGDNDFVEMVKRVYAGEGDETPLAPDGLIRDMLLHRSKLAASYPTVSADLDKMNAAMETSRSDYTDYNKKKAEIRKALKAMDLL